MTAAHNAMTRPSSDAAHVGFPRVTPTKKAGSDWRARFTPAQLEAHERLQAIRRRQKASMQARIDARQQASQSAFVIDVDRTRIEARAKLEAAIEVAAAEIVSLPPVASTIKGTGCSRARMMRAVRKVSEIYGLEPEDIFAKGRVRIVTTARAHAIAIIARDNVGVALAGIGRAFGMDHTSIIHAIRRYNAAFLTNVRGVGATPPPSPMYANLFREEP